MKLNEEYTLDFIEKMEQEAVAAYVWPEPDYQISSYDYGSACPMIDMTPSEFLDYQTAKNNAASEPDAEFLQFNAIQCLLVAAEELNAIMVYNPQLSDDGKENIVLFYEERLISAAFQLCDATLKVEEQEKNDATKEG